MAAYAVLAVIHGAHVQSREAARLAHLSALVPDQPADVLDLTPVEGSEPLGALHDRWAAFRDQFGQLTWYLVNPEGWR